MFTETQIRNILDLKVEELIKAEGSREIHDLQVEIKLIHDLLEE